MKKVLLVIMAIIVITPLSFAQSKKNKGNKPIEFKWYTFEEAYELNKKNPKKIFIDIYTDWCGWCVKMDNTTFKDSLIRDYMARNYYPVKLNAERKDTVIYNGNTYVNQSPAKPRSSHQLAVMLLQGQMSYPSFLIMNEKFETKNIIKGYREAKELEKILHYFAENAYDKMTYEKYSETFKGSVQ